jgi:hypothetical protein
LFYLSKSKLLSGDSNAKKQKGEEQWQRN